MPIRYRESPFQGESKGAGITNDIEATLVAGELGESAWDREEQQVRDLINAAFHPFLEIDPGGLICEWNRQAENLFGWTRSEAVGHLIGSRMVPQRYFEAYRQSLQSLHEASGGRQSTRLRIEVVTQSGQEFPAEMIIFPISRSSGPHAGVFVRDLRQPKSKEEQIEDRRRIIADQLAVAYHELDIRGNLTFVNKHCELFELSRVGVNYKTLFLPEETARLRDFYGKVYQTGEPATVEYPRTIAGETGFFQDSVSLLRDREGNPNGFAVVSRDCTQRKRSEIEVIKAKEAAEAAGRAKTEFLANVSHEIRTPLNGVIGMIELARETELAHEQREIMKLAQESADSLLAVINDILDFSRMEAGKLHLDHSEFDLANIIDQALLAPAEAANRKGVKFTCDLANNIPAYLLGDAGRLKQVLANLVGNAVKFTERGEVTIKVECAENQSLAPPQAQLKFFVSDTGIGIPAEKQRLIFEAFSQADNSATRKYGGTGLGLAICLRIARLMGGDLQLKSQPGKGSTFSFTANFSVQNRPEKIHASGKDVEKLQEEPRSLNILLAEDNLVNRRYIEHLLHRLGHTVTAAVNGKQALAKLRESSFDVVLMDVEMPEMDGFAATAAIRLQEAESSSRIPIIAMTAHSLQGGDESWREAGMDGYVSKPINLDHLQRAFSAVFQAAADENLSTANPDLERSR